MHKVGLSIYIQQLKQKVAKITLTKLTPFWNRVPKNSWWYWFKYHNSYLYIRLVEGLEVCRTQGLTQHSCQNSTTICNFYTIEITIRI